MMKRHTGSVKKRLHTATLINALLGIVAAIATLFITHSLNKRHESLRGLYHQQSVVALPRNCAREAVLLLERAVDRNDRSAIAEILAKSHDLQFIFTEFKDTAFENGMVEESAFAKEVEPTIYALRNDIVKCVSLVDAGRRQEAQEYLSEVVVNRIAPIDHFVETSLRSADSRIREETESMASFRRSVTGAFIAVFISMVGLLSAINVRTGRAITTPLAGLMRSTRRLASGDWAPCSEVESDDEFGELAAAFNEMVAERSRADEELRDVNALLVDALDSEKRTMAELEAAMEQLEISATTDKLTGLPNRTILTDRLDQCIKRSRRDGGKFAVLFFDFDRFKQVNDNLGHDMGDALLCDIADIFRGELRESDTVARIGGDEFVVLLSNLSDTRDARRRADEFLALFAHPHDIQGHRIVSTASIGLATSDIAYKSAGDMIRSADAAMYQAKEAGKGQVVEFDAAMHERAMEDLRIETDLRHAPDDRQFRLLYQPIVNIDTGELSGFEALLRWEHPERGLIGPIDFLRIAEDTGLIVGIGRWVLHEACRRMADWNRRLCHEKRLSVSVNVSRRQLTDGSIAADTADCLRRYDLLPGDVRLEITENMLVDERANIVPVLRQLRDDGFQIAVDDFGAGPFSLDVLHRYPIDELKIDQSFIAVLDRNHSLLAVVDAVTSLADRLGITTVAEGVETEEVARTLRSIGCRWGQGFHLGMPMTPADAEAYILGMNRDTRSA